MREERKDSQRHLSLLPIPRSQRSSQLYSQQDEQDDVPRNSTSLDPGNFLAPLRIPQSDLEFRSTLQAFPDPRLYGVAVWWTLAVLDYPIVSCHRCLNSPSSELCTDYSLCPPCLRLLRSIRPDVPSFCSIPPVSSTLLIASECRGSYSSSRSSRTPSPLSTSSQDSRL